MHVIVFAESSTKDAGRPQGRVYLELRGAALALSRAEVRTFEQRDEVDLVVRNEFRLPQVVRRGMSGPPPIAGPKGITTRPKQPFRSVSRPRQPFGSTTRPQQPFAAGGLSSEYLIGFRDAVDALLANSALSPMGVGAPPAADMQRAPDASMTYGLNQIGLDRTAGRWTGRGVKLAVLDTGVDYNHPDFANRFSDGDRIRSFTEQPDAMDDDGHGTHCAGTAAGTADSVGGQRYGVASGCDLYVGKVMGPQGGYDSDILEGISWALANGVRVISLSLGSERNAGQSYALAYERIASRLIDKPDGALLIAAAGNESRRHLGLIAPVGNPAACPSIVSIGAVDADENVAWFSCGQQDNIGLVNLAGPGVDVYSSVPGGRFDMFSGTSMATPHVAGAAALWLEADADELRTPGALWTRLSSTGRALALPPADVGRGVVQTPPA